MFIAPRHYNDMVITLERKKNNKTAIQTFIRFNRDGVI